LTALATQYILTFKELYDNHPRERKPELGIDMFSIERPNGVLHLTPTAATMNTDSDDYVSPADIKGYVTQHLGQCLDQVGIDGLCMGAFRVSCEKMNSVCKITPQTLEARAYLGLYSKQILVPEMRRAQS